MSRKIVKTFKTISNEPEEYICKEHIDLDRNAEKIEDRPMIFVGKKTTRDQQWVVQDLLELKDSKNPDKGLRGMGEAFKYMWEHIIVEVKNVCAPGDSFKGEEKNNLWDSEGMATEITEAVTHFFTKSSLTDSEIKT